MTHRNKVALLLIVISLGMLYPGLYQPMITIEIAPDLPIIGKTTFYEQTQSIVESIEFLYDNDNRLVAFLILFFSVMVPLVKAILLLLVLFIQQLRFRPKVHAFVSAISKWSMADVFVVGIFIAFLSTSSNSSVNAYLHSGFYYFLAYCIISIASVQVMLLKEST